MKELEGLCFHGKIDSEKFLRFLEIISEQAIRTGFVFFVESGEGTDFETADVEGEVLSGWLIPKAEALSFKRVWDKDPHDFEALDAWREHFRFCEWNLEGSTISIVFRDYSFEW